MKNQIPDISKQIFKDDVLRILESRYSTLGPIWVNYQMEWMNGIYSSFKNHDKFLIVIFLLKKTLNFYSRNFVMLSYDQFYQRDTVEIEKFNISEISKELNIPKESARRKINELEDLGIIKKSRKKLILDRSSFVHIRPSNTIKRMARFLTALSKFCERENLMSKEITSGNLEIIIKNNFSYIWKIYYEMQIPMLLNYKKAFKDLETFHIFGSIVVNHHSYNEIIDTSNMDRNNYLGSIINKKIQGINAMSISDITGIPRATVIRKLQTLVKNNNLTIDKKKHYRLTGDFLLNFLPTQKKVLDHLAKFSSKVFNSAQISLIKKT
tara:strand:- start:219 stop:1190 length:972 start_codon:yes stop_codon:yes gene_type:complete